MRQTEVYYELCTEDADGFQPSSFSYDTREEAEADLRRKRCEPAYNGAFVVRLTITRVGPRRPQALTAV